MDGSFERRLRGRAFKSIAPLVSAALLVGACGTTSGGGTAVVNGGTLTIVNESGALWACTFNPFNTSINFLSFGAVYEPLVQNNILNDHKTNWLASDYTWSSDNKTLTFTIRPGVKWSDGQPMTADDVVFTFQLIKSHSALDTGAVWSVLSDVSKQGADKVVMTFAQTAVPYFYYIAGQVPIVSQHIWQSIQDPVQYTDAQPVGTGPFTVSQCSPQNIAYVKNPTYWQPGLPHIDKVNYPAFESNPPANEYLATGQAQWGGQFIPNIDSYYVARDKSHNHYWFPPTSNVEIFLNQTDPLLGIKAVRQAMAMAIDRGKVSQLGENGYQPAGNQTGIVKPTFTSWYDTAQADSYGYGYHPDKAVAMLQGAGFTKNGSGIFQDAQGRPLSFSCINIGGYTDWVASLQVVTDELKAVGIEVKVQNLSSNDYYNQLYNGQFQLAYGTETGGPSPYYELRNTLYGANSAPIGQTATTNYERWQDSATDDLINSYALTSDPAMQHSIVAKLQKVMLENVPVIPTTESVSWYQWSDKTFAGWPTPQDQYANPAPWALPDWEVVLTHIHKTS